MQRTSAARGLLAAVALLALALPAAAQAASAPVVSTGPARAVSYASATLTGTLNPKGSETSYYFQYGLTRAYGGQTTIVGAGAGTRSLEVSLPIAGLQPLTQYHYRLVAVNASGPTIGADRKFTTTKVPLSLQILAAPDPVLFGGVVTVQGTLSGTENANRAVVLQANAFPFTAGFLDAPVNPELTSAVGSFTFTLPGLSTVTEFRVVTSTNPPVISPVALESVAVRVVGHVARARRPHFARIYGTVTPAENGMRVAVLRTVHGHGVLVGGGILRADGASASSFSCVVPVHPGVYRVLARVTSGALVSNYGTPLLIR